MSIRDFITDYVNGEEVLFLGSEAGEFDSAIVGVTQRDGVIVVLYDQAKVIDCLTMQGMTDDEAWDWWSFNIESAFMGPLTPAYCRTLESMRGEL